MVDLEKGNQTPDVSLFLLLAFHTISFLCCLVSVAVSQVLVLKN